MSKSHTFPFMLDICCRQAAYSVDPNVIPSTILSVTNILPCNVNYGAFVGDSVL